MTDRFSFISGRVWVCWPSQSRQLCGEINHCLYNLSCDRPDLRNSALLFPSHTHTHKPSVFQCLCFSHSLALGGWFHKQMCTCLAETAVVHYNFKLKPLLHLFCHPTLKQDYIITMLILLIALNHFFLISLFLFSLYNLLYLLSVLLVCLCLVLHYSRLFLSVFSVPSPSVRAIIFISLQ